MLRVLARLNLHFPQSGRSAAELAALAEDWCEDLAPFPLEVVERGLKYARRESRWFPSTALMIEFCSRAMGELRRHQERIALLAPDGDWEANAERGRRWCSIIRQKLDGSHEILG